MGIKDRLIKKIEAIGDEQTLQQLEQWLETKTGSDQQEPAGNPAHKPKEPSEREGQEHMFKGESHIAGDKG